MQQVIRGTLSGRNREIWIKQVQQNGQQIFQASEYGVVLRTGMQDFMKKVGSMQVMDIYGNTVLWFEPHLSDGCHLPFIIDFNGRLADNYGQQRGSIQSVGMMKDLYYVMQYNNETIEAYSWSVPGGMFEIFYKDHVQIAQLVKFEKTEKMLDEYCLCIMDGYDYLFDLLFLYTLHFDKRNFGHTRQAFFGKSADYHREVSFAGIGKSKYDANFLRNYFPMIDRRVKQGRTSTANESKWILILMLSLIAIAIVIVGIVYACNKASILLIVDIFMVAVFTFMFVGAKKSGML
ncbi:MAG: hypothetical protein Q4D54_06745 [Eubacteriales bacterium]|nr:hypothetical protein [Eubacteriales bacterium]